MRSWFPLLVVLLAALVPVACKNEPDTPVAPGSPAASGTETASKPAPKPAPPQESAPAVPTIGRLAPEIVGQDVDGQPMKLSDYRGKVVMLDFWGHW